MPSPLCRSSPVIHASPQRRPHHRPVRRPGRSDYPGPRSSVNGRTGIPTQDCRAAGLVLSTGWVPGESDPRGSWKRIRRARSRGVGEASCWLARLLLSPPTDSQLVLLLWWAGTSDKPRHFREVQGYIRANCPGELPCLRRGHRNGCPRITTFREVSGGFDGLLLPLWALLSLPLLTLAPHSTSYRLPQLPVCAQISGTIISSHVQAVSPWAGSLASSSVPQLPYLQNENKELIVTKGLEEEYLAYSTFYFLI